MTLRARITLWHTVVLLISLAIMAAVFRAEMQEDRRLLRSGQTPDSAWEETGEFVLFYGLPAALLLVAGSAWYIHRALRPVVRLTAAAERIHAHHLRERLPCSGAGDELDRLTEVFNAMTARLDESFGRIREFTLHASHELKTPLALLRAELETALRDPACHPAYRDQFSSQLDEIQRLTKIVDGLTLLAKADAGLATLKMETIRLDGLVQESFTDAQVLAQPRRIRVELGACEPVSVRGDRHRLRQLLLNLTDNAIKYNQPEGVITMALRHEHAAGELVIANTGPGIPPEKLPRVFDRFFRGDPAHGSDIEGCGLGLSIAQWIVRAHDGEIRIESPPGQPTRVIVRLPLGTDGASPDREGGGMRDLA